jgi:hypothetical protein
MSHFGDAARFANSLDSIAPLRLRPLVVVGSRCLLALDGKFKMDYSSSDISKKHPVAVFCRYRSGGTAPHVPSFGYPNQREVVAGERLWGHTIF